MTTDSNVRLTAAELLTLLKMALGGNGTRSATKELLLKSAIVAAAKQLWYHRDWSFRMLAVDLTTTASQAYVTLPSTYRSHRTLSHLWYSDEAASVCRYVEPVNFDSKLRESAAAYGTTTARPAYFTIRQRTISTVDTFVAEFTPTPDAVYTLKGLTILKGLSDIDFSGSDNVWPHHEFDVLWQALAFRRALSQGYQVPEGVKYVGQMAYNEFQSLLDQAEDRYAIEEGDSVGREIPDPDNVFSEFASQDVTTSGLW